LESIDSVEVKMLQMEKSLQGPNVMMGYFKDEQLTNEVIVDGYFHTGDIGELTGFLKLQTVKKMLFKTGRKIHCTTNHRNMMKQSRFIEQNGCEGQNAELSSKLILIS
jgi:long-chain acyl-CoA synthetase